MQKIVQHTPLNGSDGDQVVAHPAAIRNHARQRPGHIVLADKVRLDQQIPNRIRVLIISSSRLPQLASFPAGPCRVLQERTMAFRSKLIDLTRYSRTCNRQLRYPAPILNGEPVLPG